MMTPDRKLLDTLKARKEKAGKGHKKCKDRNDKLECVRWHGYILALHELETDIMSGKLRLSEG